MYYYKHMNEELSKVLGYETSDLPNETPCYVELSEEEFGQIMEEIQTELEAGQSPTEEERIAELEKENAALLYQVLTGEVYSDV